MSSTLNLSSAQLRRAAAIRKRIEKLERQLGAILTTPPDTPAKKVAGSPAPPRRRGKMSKVARARQSLAMKKRWAKAKTAGKNSL